MKKIISKYNLREESGVSLVIVAIMIVTILGFTAIAIDGGRLYFEKSRLQKAVDAAVLAGAQGLLTSEADAKTIAKGIAEKNKYLLTDTELLTTSYSITAEKSSKVTMTFAKAIGFSEVTVNAKAKAVVGPLKSIDGIKPIAVEESLIPDGTSLTCTTPGNTSGNCGYLALDGTGLPKLQNALINGGTISVGDTVDLEVDTEPGKMWKPISDTIYDNWILPDEDKPHCQSAETADDTCKRLIYVVIIESWDDTEGRDEVPIIGIAAYWVKEFNTDTKTLEGEFVKRYAPGEIDITGSGTMYAIRLTE